MLFPWLEELEKNGAVSAAAKQQIYADCHGLMKAAGASNMLMMGEMTSGLKKIEEAVKKLHPQEVSHRKQIEAAVAGGLAAAYGAPVIGKMVRDLDAYLTNKITQPFEVSGAAAKLHENREQIRTHPDFSDHSDKAEARFRELVQVAPSVAQSLRLSMPLIKRRLHSGFTDADINSLAQLQTAYSTDEGMHSKVINRMDATHPGMKKAAAASPDTMADIFGVLMSVFPEESLTKCAAIDPKKVPFVGAMGALRNLLAVGSIAGIFGVGQGAAHAAVAYQERKDLQKNLRGSFNKAMELSKRSGSDTLNADKEKARLAFQTLAHFSPHTATDPQAAMTFMRKLVEYDSGPQVADIKDLAQIEDNLQGVKAPNPFFAGMSKGVENMGLSHIMKDTISGATKPLQNQIAGVFDYAQPLES